jgi:3-phenylpropionate/trans-cinnamate dioxygenase ferredoxin reductase subunit
MKSETFAIVGAGATAFNAAETLRGEGFDGRIVMFGDEQHSPYQRPPLSKQFLRGQTAEDLVYLGPTDFYATNSIELRLGDAVERIDPSERFVRTMKGDQLPYDRLLVATGAKPRRLNVPGGELEGVRYLRTIDDSKQIRTDLERQPHVVVVGGGFIGCEVAASTRKLGCTVTLLTPKLPLENVLGRQVATAVAAFHRDHGVEIRTGVSAVEFRGSQRVEQAILSDQQTVACDVAVIGIGVTPSLIDVPSAVQSERGVETDEFLRTSVEHIWAAGDVAASWRPSLGARVRFEHFDNAKHQGAAVAKNMLDRRQPYDPVPFFWSDQAELHLQFYGYAPTWDACVIRGNAAELKFSAYYLRAGRIDAFCSVNDYRSVVPSKRLLGKAGISEHMLADTSLDLAKLSTADETPAR